MPTLAKDPADVPFSLLGIEFAPLRIPFERRLQTFAVLQWTVCFLFLGFGSLFFSVYLLFTRFYFMPLLYLSWYIYDFRTPTRGGRRSEWVRNWRIWKHYRDYFPIKLIKTADLDQSRNYIFGFHPHGIMGDGAFCNFATEANEFSKKYPGITPRLMVLDGQFIFPFHREYLMTSGACSCSKDSIDWILNRQGTGNAVVLIIGGAAEALEARRDSFVLKLSSRKGFAKMALQNGASLVPVFSFGENDLFKQMANPEGSLLRKLQTYLTKLLGFSVPLFYGRGVFNYSLGILPFRKPINTVVGSPIDVERVAEPSSDQIIALHDKYTAALQDLFETHKAEYGVPEMHHLKII